MPPPPHPPPATHAVPRRWVNTPGLRGAKPMEGFFGFFDKLSLLRDEEAGADTAVWLATDDGHAVRSRHAAKNPAAETIWYDRAVHAAHLVSSTKSPPGLAARIDKDLADAMARALAGTTAAATTATEGKS